MAPFTLNIHGAPVTYAISVVGTASSIALHMEEGVLATEFTYLVPPDVDYCEDLKFTVTPVNGAGNGASNSISLSQALNSKLKGVAYRAGLRCVCVCV